LQEARHYALMVRERQNYFSLVNDFRKPPALRNMTRERFKRHNLEFARVSRRHPYRRPRAWLLTKIEE